MNVIWEAKYQCQVHDKSFRSENKANLCFTSLSELQLPKMLTAFGLARFTGKLSDSKTKHAIAMKILKYLIPILPQNKTSNCSLRAQKRI
jgi:hypothetical protein